MGAFIARQPNGRICRFSSIVDCPTDWNMTDEDYIELCAEKGREEGRMVLERHMRPYEWVRKHFKPMNMTEEEFESVCLEMESPVKNNTDITYADIFIFVPEMRQIVRIAEGNGMNLLYEDVANGYVDYIYYDQHELNVDIPEIDGGQIMLEKPFRERYSSMEECIPDVLDMAYGSRDIPYIVLK